MELLKLLRAFRNRAFVVIGSLAVLAVFWVFLNREIHNDEAWIGQHVWSLAQHGIVESELFRDCPPLDKEIVVYHKLLVWSGLAVTGLSGWGLFQLRSISFLAGLLTLILVFWHLRNGQGQGLGWRVIAILIFTPVFWLQMVEFRPEALLLLLGFSSYLIIKSGLHGRNHLLFAIAGLVGGMAGLAHAFGFVFVIAGFVALMAERRWSPAVTVLVCGLIGFSPYLSGYFTHRELFIEQTIHNPLTTTSFNFNWWQPLVNLLTEHKRLLRKPEVIGLTVWFLFSMPFMNGEFWRKNRFSLVYLIATAAVLAASPLPKFTRYMIPLVPLMAIVVGQVSLDLTETVSGWRRHAATAFRIWAAAFFMYGAFALTREAFPLRQNQIAVNALMAGQMQPGTLVMAPFDFVYMQQGRFVIQSWWGVDRAARGQKSISFLENYADSLGAAYLIIDPVVMQAWNLDEHRLSSTFSKYQPLLSLPDSRRYLLGRVHERIESDQ